MREKYLKLIKDLEKELKKLEKKIKEKYKKGYREIKRDIELLYMEFDLDGHIDFNRIKRVGQLDILDIKIANILNDIYSENKAYIAEYLTDSIRKADITTLGLLEGIQGVIPVPLDIEEILHDTVGGRVWTERMERHFGTATYDIATTIRSGMEQGKTYTQVARDVAKYVDKDVHRPITIARTEGHRVMETTKYERIKDISEKVPMTKTWITSKDERVRSSHQSMDGVTVGIDEEFVLPSGATCLYPGDTGDPAEDINCRCTVSYRLENN